MVRHAGAGSKDHGAPPRGRADLAVSRGGELLVLRLGALQRWPLRQPPDIGGELGTFRQKLEHRAQASVGTTNNAATGNWPAKRIRPLRNPFLQHSMTGLK